MRVHVVGATGFIGSHLTRVLGDRGFELVGREAKGLDALVFLHGGRASPEAVHVELTSTLLRELRPRLALLLSSGEVYGAVPVPYREDGPIAPMTPYARAKRRAEELVLGYSGRAHVVRAGVVYGPGQRGPMLIPALAAALLQGEPFPMTAGEQSRDFIHVEDLVALLVRVLETDAPPIVNAGLGREVEVRVVARSLVRLIGERTGRDVGACLRLGALPYRDDEPMRYALSNALARSLGWEPRWDLEGGLAELVVSSA